MIPMCTKVASDRVVLLCTLKKKVLVNTRGKQVQGVLGDAEQKGKSWVARSGCQTQEGELTPKSFELPVSLPSVSKTSSSSACTSSKGLKGGLGGRITLKSYIWKEP